MDDLPLGESFFNGNTVETESNYSINGVVKRTFSIYRQKVLGKNWLAVFSCTLAVVLLLLKCVNNYRTKTAVPVLRHLSDRGSSSADSRFELCDPGEDSSPPSTSSVPTQSPEDEPQERAAKRPKLDTSPSKGGHLPSVIRWAGPSSGAGSGTPDASLQEQHQPTVTESPGAFPGTADETWNAAMTLLQFSAQEQQPQPPQEERRQDPQHQPHQQTTSTTPEEKALLEHSGGLGAPITHTASGVLRFLLQPSGGSVSDSLLSRTQSLGGGASGASSSLSEMERSPITQEPQKEKSQDLDQQKKLPPPSTSAATAASESSGAAGPSTSCDFPLSDQPSTSSASLGPVPLLGQRIIHSFARLPRVQPGGPRRPINIEHAITNCFVQCSSVTLFLKMRALFCKDELDQEDLDEMTATAEQLISFSVLYLSKDIGKSSRVRAVNSLAKRYLTLYYVVCAIKVLGEPVENIWWERYVRAIPPHTSGAYIPVGTRRETFHSVLAVDMYNAIRLLKQGVLPSVSDTVNIMRKLFCMDCSPALFKGNSWNPWREADLEARANNHAED